MKKLFLQFVMSALCFGAAAQNFQWAKGMGGTGADMANAVAVDASGNLYTVGTFAGTMDFDPGIGTYTMTALGSNDLFVTKMDGNGNFLWAKLLGSTANETQGYVKIDAAGNCYVSGNSTGTMDLDPGAATYTIAPKGGVDGFMTKLDANGSFVWGKTVGGATNDYVRAMAVDAAGNSYFLGDYSSTVVDLDPGAGTYTVAPSGGADMYTLKLDANGNFVWGTHIGGTSTESGHGIAVDASGNVITTGSFLSSVIDFDPGAGTYTLAISPGSTGSDGFISKLDANGSFVWAGTYRSGATSSDGRALATDAANNIYSVVSFGGVTDFDLGSASYTVAPVGSVDVTICKTDAAGNFIWAKSFGGSSNESAQTINVDASGNVYTFGYSGSTVLDLDPSAASYTVASNGPNDAFLSKLDANGDFVWGYFIGGTGSDLIISSTLDASNNVYCAGSFNATADFDPSSTSTYTLGSAGGNDAFVLKLSQCPPVSAAGSISSAASTICSGSTATFSLSPVTGATSYSWTVPTGASIVSGQTTNSISVTFGSVSGTITVTPSNSCASGSSSTSTITLNPLPTVSVTALPSSTVCAGMPLTLNGTGATTYSWTGGISNNTTFTPTLTASYTLTGTDANGCSDTLVVPVTVNALPTIGITATQTVLCAGAPTTLSATGAMTYTWSTSTTGSTETVNPLVPTVYGVMGTGANQCINTANISIAVNPLPNLSFTPSTNSICRGTTLTWTPTGAFSYTWMPTSFTPTTTTTYTLSGMDVNSCTNTALITVTVNPVPTVTVASNNPLICTGSSVTLTASGATTYNWNNGATTASISVTPTITTSYTVTGTNTSNCSATSVITQSVSPCTGIDELEVQGVVSVFPNPAQEEVTVHSSVFGSDVSFVVYNRTGQLVHQQLLSSETETVRLTAEAGVYYYQVISKDRIYYTGKLILVH